MTTIKRLSKSEIKKMLTGKSNSVISDIISYHSAKAAESQAIVALARRELKQRGKNESNKNQVSNSNSAEPVNNNNVGDN